MIISIFTPHGGCPERCTFCDQKVSGGTPVSVSKVQSTIEAHLKSKKVENTEVAFYGGTFTAMPLEIQKRYLSAVEPYLKSGEVQKIRISTRPDCIEESHLLFLKDKGVRVVELGVQSFHLQSLKAMGRTHTIEDVYRSVKLLKKYNFQVGLHLMVGCPEENEVEAIATSSLHLRKLLPDFLRVHPLLVIKDTALEKDYENKKFIPLELEDAITVVSQLVKVATDLNIQIIRLGLQPNELLGESIVAGAYHPAFGELVYARLERENIEQDLNARQVREGALTGKDITIQVPLKKLSQAKGQKNQNLSWLKEKYGLASIQIRSQKTVV